jgi:hypothetical protein
MTLSEDIKDREHRKFVETLAGETAVRVEMASDIQVGAVEVKDGTTDTRAVVKTDGTDNALAVHMNTIPAITGSVSVSNMIPAVETGLAKDASITVLENMVNELGRIANSLRTMPLQGDIQGCLRVNVNPVGGSAGTLPAVTTVATVTSQTQMYTYLLNSAVMNQMGTMVATGIRANLIV